MSKIENYGAAGTTPPPRTRAVDTAPAGTSSDKPATPTPSGESLRLTGDALRLQQVAQSAASAPDIDLKRVAETRQKLAEGRYEVQPRSIAAKLARLEWELSSG